MHKTLAKHRTTSPHLTSVIPFSKRAGRGEERGRINFAIITLLANENERFFEFVSGLKKLLDLQHCGKVYLVIDGAPIDNTKQLYKGLAAGNHLFIAALSVLYYFLLRLKNQTVVL